MSLLVSAVDHLSPELGPMVSSGKAAVLSPAKLAEVLLAPFISFQRGYFAVSAGMQFKIQFLRQVTSAEVNKGDAATKLRMYEDAGLLVDFWSRLKFPDETTAFASEVFENFDHCLKG